MNTLRTMTHMAFGGLMACAFAVSPATSSEAVKSSRSTANADPSIWVWDCAKNPGWQKVMRVSTPEVAQRTVEMFNRENRTTGRIFAFASDSAPTYTPDCGKLPLARPPKVAPPRLVTAKIVSSKTGKQDRKRSREFASANHELIPENIPGIGLQSSPLADTRAPFVGALPELENLGAAVPPGAPIAPVDQKAVGAFPLPRNARETKSQFDATPGGNSALNGSLRVISPVRHRFGVVPQDGEVRHVFRIKNVGRNPIQVELADRSCGCTDVKFNDKPMKLLEQTGGLVFHPVPNTNASLGQPGELNAQLPVVHSLPPETKLQEEKSTPAIAPVEVELVQHEIKPGTTARVEVRVKTSRNPGGFEQQVTLKTNERGQTLVLQVEGEVVPLIETSQSQIDFKTVLHGKAEHLQVDLLSQFSENFSIEGIDCTNSDVKVEQKRFDASELRQRGAKQGFHLDVQLSESAAIGSLEGEVIVYTNRPEMESLRFPLQGFVKNEMVHMPTSQLFLGLVDPAKGTKASLFIKAHTTESIDVKVRSVTPAKLQVTTATVRSKDGKSCYILVETDMQPGADVGRIAGTIELRTNLASARVIRIPVLGWVADQTTPPSLPPRP